MLEKKLLTVGGVIGILALGACFLPPPSSRKPPTTQAPALPPYLASIHTIAIQLEDQSASNPLDAARLNHSVADEMNKLWSESPLYSQPWQPDSHCDATLHIVIRQKSAAPIHSEPGPGSWRFTLLTSSTLTAPDGRILWQDADGRSGFNHFFQQQSPPNPWTGPSLLGETAYALAISIGAQLLFVEPGTSRNRQAQGTPQ